MEIPSEIISKMDYPNLIGMAAILWFFKWRLDKNFEKIDQRFEKIEGRISKIENDMIEVKTILRMKECCMIQDEKQLKKTE